MLSAILLGSAPDNLTRFVETLPIALLLDRDLLGTSVTINGTRAYEIRILHHLFLPFQRQKSCIIKKNKCWSS
jgi:hypothetical protein